MTLSFKDVADIVKIIDSSSCDEVVLELEGAKLVVRRGGAAGAPSGAPAPTHAQAQAQSAPGGTSQAPAAAPAAPQQSNAPAARGAAEGEVTVCSPMVGTFYTRPSPDEEPFVTVGSRIAAGAPLCMVEVMKLFTTIEAASGGTVVAVLAEDGQLVEFDQPLFVIRTD
ncbi:acetyl-CoA carboxylase, biotin carboxyl carrier protein [Brevirhabdus pacifica]|uniref:Biotin carboxyl carrier protein of acetyl-CoA carboxylase n=2 Tax=Brevirhabdus pacifica TaxID=1267768 RepID=A0A1U7DGI2_9RHOB|nr:acetyl-CoA carboxylase biotin carboxyl carrier protein [Brevirhabdus pacifica]APX89045.1 acetyl-CoA carboxylase, biotin carboxyl carrier protein [Brevirhabdus pacifica]OWU80256.1 hypothetical protein ATO5_04995 [Loktanella sp. 22II-4b]PJJ86382.1 acetyl-CoA carboxylase biotin carboxyl carrier protein [Brevirhabdus pacifica]